jgi:hypothetical protein
MWRGDTKSMSKQNYGCFSTATLGKRNRGEGGEEDLNASNVEYRRIRKIVKLNIITKGMSVRESIRQVQANSPPEMQMQIERNQSQRQNRHQMNIDSTTTTCSDATNRDEELDLWKILEQDLLEEIRLEQEMLQQQYEEQYANYHNEAMMYDISSFNEPVASNNNNCSSSSSSSSNNNTRHPHGVLCPVCQVRNLMQNGRIFFCGCGMRIDTQHDNISMDYVGDALRKHVNAHINKRCQGTPKFYTAPLFGGVTNLVMECQTCNMYEIVL